MGDNTIEVGERFFRRVEGGWVESQEIPVTETEAVLLAEIDLMDRFYGKRVQCADEMLDILFCFMTNPHVYMTEPTIKELFDRADTLFRKMSGLFPDTEWAEIETLWPEVRMEKVIEIEEDHRG